MSKKTRKKSSKPSPGKVSRATAKRPAQKSVKTTGRTSTPKSTKTLVKTAAKKSTRAQTKAPPKASRQAAFKQPRGVRAKKSATAIVVETKEVAATIATKPPAAKMPAIAPAMAPSPRTAAIEGGQAPQFRLPRDGGERVSLSDYVGRKLVIFFYPRADTPGCTREAIDFTRLAGDFAELGTAVLGVSSDPLKAQESFRNKHQLSIPLISDETHEMLQAYGAWGEKSMYGRTFQGVLRTTVLIDQNGRIAKIWHGVKVDGHADAVLTAAREL